MNGTLQWLALACSLIVIPTLSAHTTTGAKSPHMDSKYAFHFSSCQNVLAADDEVLLDSGAGDPDLRHLQLLVGDLPGQPMELLPGEHRRRGNRSRKA